MRSSHPAARPANDESLPYLRQLAVSADRLFLGLGGLLVFASLVAAAWLGQWWPFLIVALPSLAVAAGQHLLYPGTLLSRCTIALVLMALSALLIHQSGGMAEVHFVVIMAIALLMYYRDWRPIVVAAAAIAVHHLAFFWLQRQGWPLRAFAPGTGFGVLLIHAGAVVVETAILAMMAVPMRRQLRSVGHDPRALARAARNIAQEQPLPEEFHGMDFPEGSLAHTLAAASDQLLRQHAQERREQHESLRLRSALDNVTTHVMIADAQRTIVYVNRPLAAMLAEAQDDLRRDLPGFDAARLLGSSIDQFHRHPEHQARLLDRLSGTHRTQIKVGGRSMRLIINPVADAAGERLGYVVEWADRTAEVQVEEEVARIVREAARGNLKDRVALDGKQGFFRQLAQQLNELLDNNAHALDGISALLSSLSHGDLGARMQGGLEGVFARIGEDANSTAAQLTGIVRRIKDSALAIDTAAAEISAGNSDLARRTEQQAAALEQTAAAMEELTSTVKQNAEHARQANQLAQGAASVASEGGTVVGRVVATMDEIEASSKKIAEIISVIDGIAFQTNILALNAAVEAARAGEQGRGFTVVASEVRTLAQRSAAAAGEIKRLIDDSTGRVASGAALVKQAGATMGEIVASVQRVTDIMAQISGASQEQSAGIDQVNRTLAHMDESTQQNASLVEEASAAARAMEHQASQLVDAVALFRLGEDGVDALLAQAARPGPSRTERTADTVVNFNPR
ncbi:methyl-accepting chemotaxis protein [[Pseudomonas] boreopolis]|uniref:methyl-accepting chemotaxis protein n=1 Tax=Xanthomonas boreopolis TaxID=86183 RepID=UPI003DA14059